MIAPNHGQPDSLALRNIRWLLDWRAKKRDGFVAVDPLTSTERQMFALWHERALSKVRYWHRVEQILKYRRPPPRYVAPGYMRATVIPFTRTTQRGLSR